MSESSEPRATTTRQRIVAAAAQLMRTVGLAHTTTKEIARAAGCSEAALYKHFASKEELFTVVLDERLPPLRALLAELDHGPGERTTEHCLRDVAREAVLFYQASVTITASLFADPGLLARHRDAMRELDAGPHKPLTALAGFLRAEQAHGRIRPDADPEAAAALLLGACFQHAFLRQFTGDDAAASAEPVDEFAAAIARTVVHGIS